jgi:Tfp pilus assembly protein FimV
MLPVGAAVAGYGAVSGYFAGREAARTEEHIQDRVNQYQSFSNEKLQAIITTYGGEMAEAARRVLASRPAIAPAIVPVPVAQSTMAATPAAPTSGGIASTGGMGGNTMLLLAGGALLLFFAMRR